MNILCIYKPDESINTWRLWMLLLCTCIADSPSVEPSPATVEVGAPITDNQTNCKFLLSSNTYYPFAFLRRLSLYLLQVFFYTHVQDQKFSKNPFSQRFPSTKLRESIVYFSKYFSLSYKVIWWESMNSCKIPLGESKWILALGHEFLTLHVPGTHIFSPLAQC